MEILLICPKLSEYYKDFISIIEKKGDHVLWYRDGMDFTPFMKKIFKKSCSKKIDKYIDNIIEKNNQIKFDEIIIINGTNLAMKHVQKLKKEFKCKFIFYAWDSIINYPNIKTFYNLFDCCYSFDKIDCEKYGFKFLPLFYSKNMTLETPKYDLSSIMSYNEKKYNSYLKIKKCIPDNIKTNEYLFVSSKIKFYFNRFLKKKEYTILDKKFVKFKKISKNEAYFFMLDSKVVLDCPRDGQNGLTIRTFETLNFNRKLITTNKNIMDYDFYNKKNIFVIDDTVKKIPLSFFTDEFDKNYCLGKEYSIENFVNVLFYSKEKVE